MKPIKLQANTVNRLAAAIHKRNHKWWHDASGKPLKRDAGELLMLVVTELAEHVEGFRRDLMDDHLPHRKMDEIEMADAVIRILDFSAGFKIKVNMNAKTKFAFIFGTSNRCDQVLSLTRQACAVRLYSEYSEPENVGRAIGVLLLWIQAYCKLHKLNLNRAIAEKLEYNRTRKDHTHEARAGKNGKKF